MVLLIFPSLKIRILIDKLGVLLKFLKIFGRSDYKAALSAQVQKHFEIGQISNRSQRTQACTQSSINFRLFSKT
ncbi:hypothetical protein BpHYR1_030646 [Brachionus plicatilis]|uniref:Uncharacterized protein n=1 Tax=Brachionus plicatilis TaxID=10195 RepID=A0A3M7Q8E1_BRAPC|nr:hypothetical protein BpHYR1_030646 [Brachionus plicatilis]